MARGQKIDSAIPLSPVLFKEITITMWQLTWARCLSGPGS